MLFLLVLLGVALRIYCVLSIDLSPELDFKRYYEVATNLVAGHGMTISGAPYVAQPPLYPLLLGGWYSLLESNVMTGKALNILLSTLGLIFWAWLVVRSRFPAWMQLASLLIISVHPAMVAYVVVLGTETLSVFLCIILLGAGLLQGRARWLLMALICGLAILNRPQLIVVPLLVGTVILLFPRLRTRFWRGASVLIIIPFLVVTPWAIRNFLIFDAFVPVSANSGYVLMVNNNSNNNSGAWMPLSQVPLSDENVMAFEDAAGLGQSFFLGPDEGAKFRKWTPQIDKVAGDIGKRWIVDNPGKFARLAWMRMKSTYDEDSLMMWPFRQGGGLPKVLLQAISLFNFVLAVMSLLACILGLVLRPQDRLLVPWLCASAVMLGIVAGVLVFEGQGRYLMPMLPAQIFLVMCLFCRHKVGESSTADSAL